MFRPPLLFDTLNIFGKGPPGADQLIYQLIHGCFLILLCFPYVIIQHRKQNSISKDSRVIQKNLT